MMRLNYLRDEGKIHRAQHHANWIIPQRAGTARGAKNRVLHLAQDAEKDVPFEALSDIMAFRIAVDNIDDCYKALGVITTNTCRSGASKIIRCSKPNGYQSLHTIIGPNAIASKFKSAPNRCTNAESGVAAHWRYKSDGSEADKQTESIAGCANCWKFENAAERRVLPPSWRQDQVFCFTPKGDLINLLQDAMPVDFGSRRA
jgi:GTP pyrophosphokinase